VNKNGFGDEILEKIKEWGKSPRLRRSLFL